MLPVGSTHALLRRARVGMRAIFAIGFALTFSQAHAKDLHGKFGLGYNAQFQNYAQSGGVPGISLKYGLSREINMSLVFGIATTSPGNSVTALKFFKNIFYETNLNFYFMLGAGILGSADSAGAGLTSAEFLGGFGAEFFIPGIESLGFSIETGASFCNITGSFVLRTIGVSFLHAGIHFYF